VPSIWTKSELRLIHRRMHRNVKPPAKIFSDAGHDVAVVVSAMAGTTDRLVA